MIPLFDIQNNSLILGNDRVSPLEINEELALLEQKFINSGKKINVTKSPQVVRKVIETSIAKLVDAFIEVGRNFDRFYITKRFQLAIDHNTVLGEYDNTIHYAKMEMDNTPSTAPSSIRLFYTYEHFAQSDLGGVGFHKSEIRINFNNSDYELQDIHNSHISIKKLYDEELTQPEINKLLNSITENHRKFIKDVIEKSNIK